MAEIEAIKDANEEYYLDPNVLEPAALSALPYTPTGFVNGDCLAVLSGPL